MKPIDKNLLFKIQYLSALQASPSQTHYAFLASMAKKNTNDYRAVLYAGDHANPKPVHSVGKAAQFLFLDDKTLVLKYDKTPASATLHHKKKLTQLYTLSLPNGTPKKILLFPLPITLEARIDANTLLVSSVLRDADHLLYERPMKERLAYLKTVSNHDFVETFDTVPYLFNGQDFMHGKCKHYFVITLNDGGYRRVTPRAMHTPTASFDPHRQCLWMISTPPETVRSGTAGIYRYDIKANRIDVVQAPGVYRVDRLMALDNTVFVFATDRATFGLNQNPDLYELQEQGLVRHSVYGHTVYNTIGTDCRYGSSLTQLDLADRAYFVTTRGTQTWLQAVHRDGMIETVHAARGSIDGIAMVQGDLVVQAMIHTRLPEIYVLKEQLVPWTRLNRSLFRGKAIAIPEPVSIERDGVTIDGFVMTPSGENPQLNPPAILNIHGGPKTVYGEIFYHEMQTWASQGYVVMFCNPRGSDGKGDAFADIRGRYGTIDYEDIMAFVDKVKLTHHLDPERLYVTGGSYGGFMTNWIVGQTSMFRAAVTQRSISNWVSFCGTSDIGITFGQDQTGGHPITDHDALWDQSPLKYAHRVTTPTLVLHSAKDHRCPIEQAQQFYSVLVEHNVKTKFVWFHEENHELSRSGAPAARIQRLTEIEEWFQ